MMKLMSCMRAVLFLGLVPAILTWLPAQRSWAGWATFVADNGSDSGLVGSHASLAMVNGHPAIAYYDSLKKDLKYVRATDAAGTVWVAPVVLDSTGDVGKFASLKLVNGKPAVAYYDDTNNNLKYVQADDAMGVIWGVPLNADIGVVVGDCSLAVVNGKPSIAFNHIPQVTKSDLKYARAYDADGTGWQFAQTIDSGSSVGQHVSLEVIGGNPAVGYYDNANDDLKYIRALDGDGAGWGSPIVVDTTGNVGEYASLTAVNGKPAIAYYDNTNDRLKYVRSSDTTGTSWMAATIIDAMGNPGWYPSLEVVNGKPAIAYLEFSLRDLKYVTAADADGAAWGSPITIKATGNVGFYASLEIIGGFPAIAYHDATLNDVNFVRSTNASGTEWGEPVVPDRGSGGDVGQFPSLEVVNGRPAIAHYDSTSSDLRYVRAANADGTVWGVPIALDALNATGQYASLKVVDGKPAISYVDTNVGGLKYIGAADANGSTWGTPMVLDASVWLSRHSSLEVVNGKPAVAYYDALNKDLKYIRATDATGTSWGTPMSVEMTGDMGQYCSLCVVNAKPAITYYEVVEPTVGSNKLKYIRATDADGTTWGSPQWIHGGGNYAGPTALEVVDGKPAIAFSYYVAGLPGGGGSASDLRYLEGTDVNGSDWIWNNVGTADSSSDSSLTVFNNAPVVTYFDSMNSDLKQVRNRAWNTQITIDSSGNVGLYNSSAVINGKVAVAYYDRTNGDLKYAVEFPDPTPMPVNDSVVLSHTIPANIAPDASKVVGITLSNTGNTTWTMEAVNAYALEVTEDACGLSPVARFALQGGGEVAPGAQGQYVGQLLAPAAPQSCGIKFRMRQEFVEWFGETLEVTIAIEEPPNRVADWAGYE